MANKVNLETITVYGNKHPFQLIISITLTQFPITHLIEGSTNGQYEPLLVSPEQQQHNQAAKTTKKAAESPFLLSEQSPSPNNEVVSTAKPVVAMAKVKKKAGGARLWMRFDSSGESKVFECDNGGWLVCDRGPWWFTVVVVVGGGWWCSVRVVVVLGEEEDAGECDESKPRNVGVDDDGTRQRWRERELNEQRCRKNAVAHVAKGHWS
ncbi:hypothetical protein Hanom_Chr16g01439861 [Helianthus anomalus]